MAKVGRKTIGSASQRVDPLTWAEFIDSFNCSLVHTEVIGDNLYVRFYEDSVYFRIAAEESAGWLDVYTMLHTGSETYRNVRFRCPAIVTVCCNDNFFYFQFGLYSAASGGRYIFYYEKFGDKRYYAYNGTGTGSATFYDISSLTLTETTTSTQCYFCKVIPYGSTILNAISFIDHAVLTGESSSDTGVLEYTDYNFIGCSTVTYDNVLTFNGHNYYSIGTNILVPIDD